MAKDWRTAKRRSWRMAGGGEIRGGEGGVLICMGATGT